VVFVFAMASAQSVYREEGNSDSYYSDDEPDVAAQCSRASSSAPAVNDASVAADPSGLIEAALAVVDRCDSQSLLLYNELKGLAAEKVKTTLTPWIGTCRAGMKMYYKQYKAHDLFWACQRA
jgi:hypothetical protein